MILLVLTLFILIIILIWYIQTLQWKAPSETLKERMSARRNFNDSLIRTDAQIGSPKRLIPPIPRGYKPKYLQYSFLKDYPPLDTLDCPQTSCPNIPDYNKSWETPSYSSLYCPTPAYCPPLQSGIGVPCDDYEECSEVSGDPRIDGTEVEGPGFYYPSEYDRGFEDGELLTNQRYI